MFKRLVAQVLIFSALAMLLGHNFVPHHHHDFENITEHHHHADHTHGDEDTGHNDDDQSDLRHLLSHLFHSEDGIIFLPSQHKNDINPKHILPLVSSLTNVYTAYNTEEYIRQQVPPDIPKDYNSREFLPFGLRAPPFTVV